ncbi:MAG TPA: methyltransferase domain-containing protein [Solirubrobacteraceae bacterium]|jgi:SAM-dependent methyltransferase|nr:methyltransferase domain-containing protein [Solirubrobacteraceae bacterium]
MIRFKLDCEAKYLAEEDPWGIGEADSARYDLYVDAIRLHARGHGSVLDVGCGFGAMLARLRPDFDRLHGIELSAEAVAKGATRYPFIDFERGSIDALERTDADRDRFDAIVFSDVIYYVDEAARRASLHWIAEHLRRDGLALIAAYSPGGREYLTPAEVCTLVEREFVIERLELLESEHLMLLARPRRRLAALTLDYETWQPIPAERRIDWDADVFAPTEALLDACDAAGARLTIFAELGEHAFLREHEPELADRMEAQWRDAVRRGHDVQLHLHPNWLPELGARLQDSRYVWNERLTRAEDHPDLVRLIARLKQTLERAIRPVDPDYQVVAFRAGGYEAQPFRRLAEALRANDVRCDSSVYHGGRRPGVYHDYSWPFDPHQPWFASHSDPQLQAPPAERGIVELPVATFARNDRWTFDLSEGRRFGERLLALIEAERTAGPSTELARRSAKARQLLGAAHYKARSHRRAINRVVPRALAHALVDYPPPRLLDDDFYVAVGHSKADLEIPAIREQLRLLREGGVELVRLSELAALAREQLEHHVAPDAASEARRQVRAERATVLGAERNDAQSRCLQTMVPLDRARILDLGCGAGEWSARIAAERPWARVTGVDAGEEFILAARRHHASARVDFTVADFLSPPFADGTFDCIYADNVLEHAYDVDATLAEARRMLSEGGVLVAAIPPDAYDTRRGVENHTWRTSAGDVRERLARAGFVDVAVAEADTYRLGAAPYPPAADRMLYVRAWRRAAATAPIERVDALRRWARERSDPRLLGDALVREGFALRWVTMLAQEHPHGYGPRQECSHQVIELTLPDGARHVLDPLAGVRFPYALQALLENALLADSIACSDVTLAPDHELYATSFWYRRVVAVAVRERLDQPLRFVPARWIDSATDPRRQALAVFRLRGWRAIRRLRPA